MAGILISNWVLARKLVYCYLYEQNLEMAKAVLQTMSPFGQSHRLSLYLLYCVAVRSREEDVGKNVRQLTWLSVLIFLADQALESLDTCGRHRSETLIACVSETLRSGSKEQGAKILQRLLDRQMACSISDMDMGALLRWSSSSAELGS